MSSEPGGGGGSGGSNSFYYIDKDGKAIDAKTLQIVSQWRAQDEIRLNHMEWHIKSAKVFAVTAWVGVLACLFLCFWEYV